MAEKNKKTLKVLTMSGSPVLVSKDENKLRAYAISRLLKAEKELVEAELYIDSLELWYKDGYTTRIMRYKISDIEII